jgi:hypothetical protein
VSARTETTTHCAPHAHLNPRTSKALTTEKGRASLTTTNGRGLPIIKWVGGKGRILSAILAHYQGQAPVVEPFLE